MLYFSLLRRIRKLLVFLFDYVLSLSIDSLERRGLAEPQLSLVGLLAHLLHIGMSSFYTTTDSVFVKSILRGRPRLRFSPLSKTEVDV